MPRALPAISLAAGVLAVSLAGAGVVLDDPLQGSTAGARSGGTFAGGGWQVAGKDDSILWHIPTVREGAAEWDVKGLRPGECRAGLEDHGELFHMYDHTYAGSDTNYNPGYRDNPFKHFVRKQGCIDIAPDRAKLLWKIGEEFEEIGTSPLAWDEGRTYRFRLEWGPAAGGRSSVRLLRDGAVIASASAPGEYAPAGHSVRIGASTRRDAAAGAPLGAVFSHLKVWDLSEDVPAAPTITQPPRGARVSTPLAFIAWRGDAHARFQARVSTAMSPDAGIAWDSGETASAQDFTFTGPLADLQRYEVFVRLGSATEWGPWSAAGHSFTVDLSHVPPGPERVALAGNALVDRRGPYLGLGATYFSALRHARSDRARLHADLDFLRSRGFNYVRVLSMVGWYPFWQGLEIAPVAFTTQDGRSIAAWADYWQQLRDLIEIVEDHGLRTQVTVFADAQLMPEKAARIAHLDGILDAIAGREQAVILLEVANEAWQNGFPGAQGIADLREFGKHLADRTDVLVALSAPLGGTNADLTELYSGSAADIATEHFSRDIGTVEGGWLPVRDCWRGELAAGVPPISSNEPIGPGSSVAEETDPIKLVMAAAFAWGANLPMYVFHSRAGIRSLEPFEGVPGIDDFVHLASILPPDLASWVRNDGLEPGAPFTVFADGQPGRYWPGLAAPQSGAVRNTGKVKGSEFVCLPMGILAGGVVLEARRPVSFDAFDPLTGASSGARALARGQRFTLPRGPGAWILKGTFTDAPGVPLPPVIAEVEPDPDAAAAGSEYTRRLALAQGSPPPSWEVLQGPQGLRVDATGLVSGWTPAAAQVGSRFTLEVRATNALGSDTESWRVDVAERTGAIFPFDQGAEGWALAGWKSGPYEPGTAVWQAAGGNPGGNIASTGSGDSNNQDTCTREGSVLTRAVSTAGLRSIQVEYDVMATPAGPPGPSGAGSCPVLEGTAEDKLVVSFSTSGTGGPWTVAQVLGEAELPGSWSREVIDLAAREETDDSAAFALRFQWQFNARLDEGRIDNVSIRGTPILLGTRFARGDPNADGERNISDALFILGALFLGASSLECEKSADSNDSGGVDLSDPVHLLNHLFNGGPAPRPPYPECGTDATPDDLPCPAHAGCAG
jgi:hypothetical protein